LQPRDFVKGRLHDWYSRSTVAAPPLVSRREFGYGNDVKIEARHVAFRDEREMNYFLRTTTPLFVSCSLAYYETPDGRPMDRKGWQGADLAFDFDAKDYETPCKHPPQLSCGVCMDRVKQECAKLVEEFLIPDFGFSLQEIGIVFSGNKGYHVYVRGERVHSLSGNARKELADYLDGTGLEPELLGLGFSGRAIAGPTPGDGGWRGRVARWISSSLSSAADEKALAKRLGVSLIISKKLIEHRGAVLEGIARGSWDQVAVGLKTWDRVFRLAAVDAALRLDKGCTIDVSRLLRLPGSIHGDSGLVAMPVRSLSQFDPFRDPVAFGNSVVPVVASQDASFTLAGEEFALRSGKRAELPEAAAVYAAAKKLVSEVG
jgi:DNA primase small subunit